MTVVNDEERFSRTATEPPMRSWKMSGSTPRSVNTWPTIRSSPSRSSRSKCEASAGASPSESSGEHWLVVRGIANLDLSTPHR